MSGINKFGKSVYLYGDNLVITEANSKSVIVSGNLIGGLFFTREGKSMRFTLKKGTNYVLITGRFLKITTSTSDFVRVYGEISSVTPYKVNDEEAENEELELE